MILFRHELRQGRRMLLIWSAVVGFMILICMLMYPEMGKQMGGIDKIFSQMGGFTEAFGMDKLSLGSVMGFYGIECGNVLGIGGAFFAALLGISSLAKEEAGHTAEFLLTHPISRMRVTWEKLAALICQLILFNAICIACSLISFVLIDEQIEVKAFVLFHIAQFLLQLEIALICFAISSFLRRSGLGLGLGFAALLYFLNIIGNIGNQADWLKYITPFKYADASSIIPDGTLDGKLIILGMVYTLAAALIAFLHFRRKDISV
ncbi:ABC transporter permease [Clostridiales Family XIII bacterium ASD5510]|uniref:ABC transporter permease n=1 Tax=Hominibacterium faecale TaxID=2839743 RepID=A0A9J6QNE5_9FIRM|nr:ABC transporter permease subunit [Hominibacterium faecale]MCU7377466.1 ABC transporter permease [Hominibacterium faecale]